MALLYLALPLALWDIEISLEVLEGGCSFILVVL